MTTAELERLFESVKNWGRWGADDERGALNYITAARREAAARLVRDGEAVSCALELPVLPGPDNPTPAQHHMVIAGDAREATGVPHLETALDYIGIACHGMATSHIDALCHVFVRGQMYNGFPASDVKSTGATRNSIMAARDGIVSRGVLLDIPRLRGVPWLEPGTSIARAELEAAERAQNVRVGEGDVLLVATGRADVMVDPMMFLWDAASLQPILEEAGGTFTDWQGEPTIYSGEGIATNGLMLKEVLAVTRQAARLA